MPLMRRPRKGDVILWPHNGTRGTVVSTPEGDDNLCWITVEVERAMPFIWRHRDHDTGGCRFNQLAEIIEMPEVRS